MEAFGHISLAKHLIAGIQDFNLNAA